MRWCTNLPRPHSKGQQTTSSPCLVGFETVTARSGDAAALLVWPTGSKAAAASKREAGCAAIPLTAWPEDAPMSRSWKEAAASCGPELVTAVVTALPTDSTGGAGPAAFGEVARAGVPSCFAFELTNGVSPGHTKMKNPYAVSRQDRKKRPCKNMISTQRAEQ